MKSRYNVHGPLHAHPVFHIMYILEGKGRFTVGSTTTEALPGMLYIINPNEPHRFIFGLDEPLTNLESTFQLLDAAGNAAEVHFFDFARAAGPTHPLNTNRPLVVPARLRPLLTEGFDRILELYDAPLLRSHFGLMVAELLSRVETVVESYLQTERPLQGEASVIASIKQYLHTHRGRPITLKEIADFAHLTPNYLCRLFKAHTGESPFSHLQGIRMREAEQLLALTDLPVYAIAERLGYEEPSYFARVFRSVYGIAPAAYRMRLLADTARLKR